MYNNPPPHVKEDMRYGKKMKIFEKKNTRVNNAYEFIIIFIRASEINDNLLEPAIKCDLRSRGQSRKLRRTSRNDARAGDTEQKARKTWTMLKRRFYYFRMAE